MMNAWLSARRAKKLSKALRREFDSLYSGGSPKCGIANDFIDGFVSNMHTVGTMSPTMIHNSVMAAWLRVIEEGHQGLDGRTDILFRSKCDDWELVETFAAALVDSAFEPNCFRFRFEKMRSMFALMASYPNNPEQVCVSTALVTSPLAIDYTLALYRLMFREPKAVVTIRGLIGGDYDELMVRARLVLRVMGTVGSIPQEKDVHTIIMYADIEEVLALSACHEARLQDRIDPLIRDVATAVDNYGAHPSRSLRVSAALKGVRYPEDTDWDAVLDAWQMLGSTELVEALFGAKPDVRRSIPS